MTQQPQQPQQPPPPPTRAELASVLLATHAALGRIPPAAFATIPDSILARLDAVVKRLADCGRRPRRTGRDPLLERLRACLLGGDADGKGGNNDKDTDRPVGGAAPA